MQGEASEGEGACLSLSTDRSHLPLRGKLGWMTPRAGVKTTPAIETRLLGPPIPSGGPFFLSPADPAAFSLLLVDLARHSDARSTEYMCYLCLAQTRSVIFKRQLSCGIVHAEAAQPISVCELPKIAHLLFCQRRLQFECDFHECHAQDYTSSGKPIVRRAQAFMQRSFTRKERQNPLVPTRR